MSRVENLLIDYRFGDDQLERVSELGAELVKSGVELIVVQGAAVSEIAKQPLPVPIVYIFSGDPTAAGFADSLARPRGNMTGVTLMAAELNSKRLEILRDIVPELRRVAIIANPEHDGVNLERANSEETGQRLGIDVRYYPTPSVSQLNAALAGIKSDPVQAVSISPTVLPSRTGKQLLISQTSSASRQSRHGPSLPEAVRSPCTGPCNPSSTVDLQATSTGSRKAPSLPICRSSGPRNRSRHKYEDRQVSWPFDPSGIAGKCR